MIFVIKLLLCFCFVRVSYAKNEKEIRTWFLGLGMECNKEISVSAEDLQALHDHKIPDSEPAQCLLACVYKKATWIDSKGSFDLDSANAMIEKEHLDDSAKAEKSKQLFEMCKKVNDEAVTDGDKGCQRSAFLTKCLIENGPKLGLSLGI